MIVYCVLDFFVEYGFIYWIELKNVFFVCCEIGVLYEGQFLICDLCGDIVEIFGGDFVKQLFVSEFVYGFEVYYQVVELSGLCGYCKCKFVQC